MSATNPDLKIDNQSVDPAAFWYRYVVLGIVVLAALMRLCDLGVKSLWFDETHTYNDAFREYIWWRRPHYFYFQLVEISLWIGGMSDFWLRLPSALFGVMGVLVMYALANEVLNDRRTALMSAIFTCFSLVHLDYSQEARYYAAIFFWSSLGVYLLARFLRRRCLVSLLLLPVACLLNYFTHPVALVMGGITIGWLILGLFVTSQGRQYLKTAYHFVKDTIQPPQTQKKSGSKSKRRKMSQSIGLRWGQLALLVGGLAVVMIGMIWMGNLIWPRAKSIQLFTNPVAGAEFTWDFFFNRHFLPFGPGERVYLNFNNPLHLLLVVIYCALAILGYGRALIKRPFFATLAIASIIIAFTLLFSMGYTQSHQFKYVIFLYPMHIAFLMYGLSGSAEWLERAMASKGRKAVIMAGVGVMALFWLPNGIFWAGGLYNYFTLERSGAKPALKIALSEFDLEKDYIAAYGVTTYVLDYYAKQWDIPRDRLISILGEKGDGSHTVERIRRAASQGGRVWFLYTWKWDMKEVLFDWVQQNFDLVKTYPSFYGRDRDVTLWEWKYAGRVVSSQNDITVECPLISSNSANNEEMGRLGEFYSYLDLDYQIDVGVPPDLKSTSGSLILNFSHGQTVEFHYPQDKDKPLSANVILSDGVNRVTGQWRSEKKSQQSFPISISPVDRNTIQYRAAAFDEINPSTRYVARKIDQGVMLELTYNNSIVYHFDIKETGQYLIGLRAVNDVPGPIIFQVNVDDHPMGLLSFDKADQSVETKLFPVMLSEGWHDIRFSFISNVYTGRKMSDDEDNTAQMERVIVQRVMPDEPVVDNRVWLPMDRVVDLDKFITWPPVLGQNQSSAWQLTGYDEAGIEFVESKGERYPALYGTIKHEIMSAQAISPAFPVNPGELVYFQVKVRTREVHNHTANVQVAFLDANGRMISQQWVNGQGVLEDTDEVSIISLIGVPPGSKLGVVGLSVYSRGTKIFASTGEVWFFDFKSGHGLLKQIRGTAGQ